MSFFKKRTFLITVHTFALLALLLWVNEVHRAGIITERTFDIFSGIWVIGAICLVILAVRKRIFA